MHIGNAISNFGNKIGSKIGKTGTFIKAKSPEILIGTGILLVIGGTFMACRGTAKAKEVLEARKNEIEDIKANEEKDIFEAGLDVRNDTDLVVIEKQIHKEAKGDVFVANVRCGWELTKLFAPALMLEAAGIGCFLAAHGIMRKRNAALMAAYEATDKAYQKLKEKYMEKVLPEKQEEIKSEESEKEKEQEHCPFNPDLGPNAFIFDRTCNSWHNDVNTVQSFAKYIERQRTKELQSGRTIFLNDIRTDFGKDLPGPSYRGQNICWSKDLGDTEIDLGLTFGPWDKEFWINPIGGHPIEEDLSLRRR